MHVLYLLVYIIRILFFFLPSRFYSALQQEFALSLIQQASRQASLEELRPFLPYLLKALESDDVDVSSAALALIGGFVRNPGMRGLFAGEEELSQIVQLACANMKRFHRTQDARMFTLTCQLLEGMLQWEAVSLDACQTSVIKSYCLSALDAHPTRCMKILANLLRRHKDDGFDKEGATELLKQICRLYVERPSKPLVDGAASILVAESTRTGLVLDFLVENFNYPDAQGRSKVIALIQRLVQARLQGGKEMPESHAQKVFLLSAHRLANEDSSDVRKQLHNLIRSLLQLCPSLTETVVKWSTSKEPLKKMVASKVGVLCGEAGLLGACLAVTRNLSPVLKDSGSHDLLSTMVKCHVIEASSVLLNAEQRQQQQQQQQQAMDLSFLGALTESLVDLTLSPMASLRSRLLPLIVTCLSRRECSKHLSAWRDKKVANRLFLNLFQLLKTCPTGELQQVLEGYFRAEVASPEADRAFFERLRVGFNYERREDPKSFVRRKIVLEVLIAVTKEQPEWNAKRVHSFLAQFEEVEEIRDQVKAVLKAIHYQEDKEEADDKEDEARQVVAAAGIKTGKKASKRRIFSNARQSSKRLKM